MGKKKLISSIASPITSIANPQNALVIPTLALRSVTSKTGMGVFASSDTLYKGAIFGRDSLEVADDLMRTKPRLARNILMTLASLQGTESHNENEEEPGKIIHEYRNAIIDKKPIGATSLDILHHLSQMWGGTDTELAYYGSVDATPHFLSTLGAYISIFGKRILANKVTRRDGRIVTMLEIANSSATWLTNQLENSKSGLLEYKRRNPLGIANQVWKDSKEFYVHENKEVANHEMPIASIEVQGLVYDALFVAAKLLPLRAEKFKKLAYGVRDRTIELLWQPDRNYFALGTDFDKKGKLRVIQTATANPAALLDSGFFDRLPAEQRELYVGGIVKQIMSSAFLTDAGIRSRSLYAADLIGFWDYHGSFASWPKETYDIAKGLRHQGFPKLAKQLENRLLNVFLKSRLYMEFVFVDEEGRVLATIPNTHIDDEVLLIESHNQPERIQAWTVSAIIAILSWPLIGSQLPLKNQKIPTWAKAVEKQVLSDMRRVNLYINPFTLYSRYPTYPYKLVHKRDS